MTIAASRRPTTATEIPYDLFLGVPHHRAPTVVLESDISSDGWIPVNPLTLETPFDGVYAVGDVAEVGTPRAGVFAEGQAKAAAKQHRSAHPGRSHPTRATTVTASVISSSARTRSGRSM